MASSTSRNKKNKYTFFSAEPTRKHNVGWVVGWMDGRMDGWFVCKSYV